ncbi:MAG TPA: thiamine pyrophosphate-binding protein [Gemmataceae bacterium]|nr:thiamine pyrophosphate-binding protein [Gemmataceae bacterium]
MNGADLLVRQLKAQGVPFVTTLCGNGLDPLYVACKKQGLRLIDVRNEQAAGYMADAIGRLTRRVGVCTSSSGVAHVNALTGVTNAYFDGSPMLLITGASDSRTAGMGNFQDLDHVALARPICKLAQRVDRPERIALAVHEAFSAALSGRPGPVHLTIPSDVLQAPVKEADVQRWLAEIENGRPPTAPRAAAEPELVREAVDLLARAERPLLIAGSGVFYADAEEPLRNLAAAIGLPVVTPIWDRGAVSRPMPEFMGVIGGASGAPPLLSDADLLLLVGARVDYRVGYLKPPAISAKARVVRIDRDPAELNQGARPDLGLLGDPGVVLKQLWEEWLRRHLPARSAWLKEAQARNRKFRARWARLPAAPPLTGQHLVEGLRPVLTDDVLFLIDGGNIGQWAHVAFWDRYPGHWLTCGASAVVGWGLPAAIAVKLLHPDRPVLLLSGDGAIGFTIAELEIAVRHKAPIVIVLADDEAWGIVASGQKRSLGEPIASLLGPVDYVRVAQGFGARGVLVEKVEDLAPAVRQAFASGQPTLIEVPIALLGTTD